MRNIIRAAVVGIVMACTAPVAAGPFEDGLGHGVPPDYVEAHKWSNLAAAQGDANDVKLRDVAAELRDIVAQRMTPAQIAEAQKLAREWKPTKP